MASLGLVGEYIAVVAILSVLGAGVLLALAAVASRASSGPRGGWWRCEFYGHPVEPSEWGTPGTEDHLRFALLSLGYRLSADEIADLPDEEFDRLCSYARREWARRCTLDIHDTKPFPEPALLAGRRERRSIS